MNEVLNNAIRLRPFPFSLKDKAKFWVLPNANAFTIWDRLSKAFLCKYYPPGKTTKLHNDITPFTQIEEESLY